MNKNLYVGNLSIEVTEDDLKASFSEVGKVISVNLIKDKYTGLNRGFGFVEMETEKKLKKLLKDLMAELCAAILSRSMKLAPKRKISDRAVAVIAGAASMAEGAEDVGDFKNLG